MVTVSEIKFIPEKEGKCPQCGRVRMLGHINTADDSDNYSRCIDCCFGPPQEYWERCEDCGQLYVGEHCDNPYCETGKYWKR